MEINTEMNKIFGQEMAKLFAATIDEDELKRKAEESWKELNKAEWKYGSREHSAIENYIKNEILTRLYNKIEEILKEPVNEEEIEKQARAMVELARKAGEEAIVRDLAKHMVENALSVYNRDERIVNEVLNRLNMRSSNNRLY